MGGIYSLNEQETTNFPPVVGVCIVLGVQHTIKGLTYNVIRTSELVTLFSMKL